MLIEGGYIVTNAHVVWPYGSVRVFVTGRSGFLEVPVKGLDLIAGLAVLGPIDAPFGALILVDGESIPIGTDTYLIGYRASGVRYPQPMLKRGALSGIHEQESIGLTYLHTDADFAGGHSGSALVSEMGEVIGILSYRPTDTNLGFAASSTDILPRVRQLIAGGDPAEIGDRSIPRTEGELRHEVQLQHFLAQSTYVFDELSGTSIDIEFEGDEDGLLWVSNLRNARLLYIHSGNTEAATISFVTEYEGPYFLITQTWADGPGDFTVTSSHRMMPFHDPDDGRHIRIGDSVRGNMDFSGDIDQYFVTLSEGDTIEVAVSSVLINSALTLSYVGARDDQAIAIESSGDGVFERDSKIIYRAPHTGTYFVYVNDFLGYAPGGYVIAVEAADADAPLTQRTRSDLLREAGVAPTPSASLDFGLAELRSGFSELPDSFAELDPAGFGISIEGLGLKDLASDLAVFANNEPLQIIFVASGELPDLVSIAVDSVWSSDTLLDEIVQGETSEVLDSGKLQSSTVGDSSFGVFLETAAEGVPQRMEMIMFRRGNLFGGIFSYTLAGTEPVVSVEELARMLDAQMIDFLGAREP